MTKMTDGPVGHGSGHAASGRPGDHQRAGGGRGWLIVCLLLLIGGGTAGWYYFIRPSEIAKPAAAALSGPPPVPVVAGVAQASDVPIYLRGIGVVQAYNTVTVKPRVDGQLQKVAFTEGQHVKIGDVLAQIDPRPLQAQLAQVTASKARDEALLANAKLDLDRYSSLANREYASKQSVDTQRALVNQYDATVKNDQAQIDYAQVQLGYTTITSPIDGVTGIRAVDEGNIVHATDTTGLVVLAQLQPISVIFTLPEDNVTTIKRQLAAGRTLTVSALSSDNKESLGEGTLSLIDNQIDQTTGTIRIKATFPNKSEILWPGEFVNARLLLQTRPQAVTVPDAVVQRGPQGTFAYVIKPDQTVEMRPITVGQIDGGVALIESGIAANEQVVVDGQYKLRNGIKVAATTPSPQPAKQASAAP
ncbi:MAG TPA: efflux RND transporter periplasmic adaptor subunit [Stellaceae bacterium]|nr:efflux RND transporter periplasmic adaptor subunit [Stellaceae bacterium]